MIATPEFCGSLFTGLMPLTNQQRLVAWMYKHSLAAPYTDFVTRTAREHRLGADVTPPAVSGAAGGSNSGEGNATSND